MTLYHYFKLIYMISSLNWKKLECSVFHQRASLTLCKHAKVIAQHITRTIIFPNWHQTRDLQNKWKKILKKCFLTGKEIKLNFFQSAKNFVGPKQSDQQQGCKGLSEQHMLDVRWRFHHYWSEYRCVPFSHWLRSCLVQVGVILNLHYYK